MEVYGVKPKKFTKAWFEYVWEYYKIHITVTILVIAAIIYTVTAIANRPFYDLTVCITGDVLLSEGNIESLKNELTKSCDDINGDGKIRVSILDYTVAEDSADAQYVAAVNTKLMLEFQTGDAYICIMPKEKADSLLGSENLYGLFAKTEQWQKENGDDYEYAELSDNDILINSGILDRDLVMTVKNITADNNSEKAKKMRENSVKTANYIIGQVK